MIQPFEVTTWELPPPTHTHTHTQSELFTEQLFISVRGDGQTDINSQTRL